MKRRVEKLASKKFIELPTGTGNNCQQAFATRAKSQTVRFR